MAAQGWSVYIPAIITASAAFIGAMLAQYVSPRLSMRREREKSRYTAYEKLFAPVAPDVMAYLDAYWCPHGDSVKTDFQGDRCWIGLRRISGAIWLMLGENYWALQ